MFFFAGQVVTVVVRFTATPDATPQAVIFANGAQVGGSINGVGSGILWVFTMTLPNPIPVGRIIQMEATASIGGVTQYVQFLQGQIAEWTTYPDIPPVVIPPSVNPLTSTGYCLCIDESGVVEEDVMISVRLIQGPGNEGYSYHSPVVRVLSDEDGLALVPGMIRGATYEVWRGKTAEESNRKQVVVPNAGSFELPETI